MMLIFKEISKGLDLEDTRKIWSRNGGGTDGVGKAFKIALHIQMEIRIYIVVERSI